MVFDDAAPLPDGRPGFFAPYFSREPVVMDETHDYIDETIRAANATTCTWLHPLTGPQLLAVDHRVKPSGPLELADSDLYNATLFFTVSAPK